MQASAEPALRAARLVLPLVITVAACTGIALSSCVTLVGGGRKVIDQLSSQLGTRTTSPCLSEPRSLWGY